MLSFLSNNGQLFVATHSSDILRGFLESTKGNLRILRIERDSDQNRVFEATPEIIRTLWEKPNLRYSNALEGIFHEQAIICEDHSDCRLFQAVADHIAENNSKPFQDTAYIPAGGKDAIPKIAETLRKVGVPVRAVFDFDLLREENKLKAAVNAFDGDWPTIQNLWSQINAEIRQKTRKDISVIKEEILEIIEQSEANELPKRKIDEAMKQSGPWAQLKRLGKHALPRGDIQTIYGQLETQLSELGIHIVSVGEAESFCPDIGDHGPGFVTKLLETKDLSDPSLEALRSFVTKLHAPRVFNQSQ